MVAPQRPYSSSWSTTFLLKWTWPGWVQRWGVTVGIRAIFGTNVGYWRWMLVLTFILRDFSLGFWSSLRTRHILSCFSLTPLTHRIRSLRVRSLKILPDLRLRSYGVRGNYFPFLEWVANDRFRSSFHTHFIYLVKWLAINFGRVVSWPFEIRFVKRERETVFAKQYR